MIQADVGRILQRIESCGYSVETDTADGLVCMAAVDDAGGHHVVTAPDVMSAAQQLIEHLGLDHADTDPVNDEPPTR